MDTKVRILSSVYLRIYVYTDTYVYIFRII